MSVLSVRRRVDRPRLDRQTRGIIVVVSLGTVIVAIDITVVNIALETLSRDLHSSLSEIQWVVSAYALALAAVIPMAGWAARRFGARQVLILSLLLFTLGSALCGAANSLATLVLFRVLQGVGGGMLIPVGQLIVASHAGPTRMGRLMGLVSVPMILAPTVGPTLGGVILQHLSWRWLFYINVPIGVLAIALALRLLPSTHKQPTGRFDFVGMAMLSGGFPLLVYGLSEFGTNGAAGATTVVLPVAAGLVLLALFAAHARRVERPLLDLRLFANRVFAWAQVAIGINSVVIFGGIVMWPLYYQLVRHESLVDTGLLVSPSGMGVCVVLPLAGRLADRFGGGRVARVGVFLTMVATIPLALVTATTPLWLIGITLFARGAGVGFTNIAVTAAAYSSLRPEQLPDGTAEMNVLQRVAGSFGVAMSAVILQRAIAQHGQAPTPGEYADAFDIAFWCLFALSTLTLLPTIMLTRRERKLRAGVNGVELPSSHSSGVLALRDASGPPAQSVQVGRRGQSDDQALVAKEVAIGAEGLGAEG
jgi:EmrB/QacA subfamily drug resistance transporter